MNPDNVNPDNVNPDKGKDMIRKTILTVGSSLVLAAALCAQEPRTKHDILTVAGKAGRFDTLVTAVKAAGLVDALEGKGPFTVFAPTDEAFAELGKDTLQSLLKPENRDKLAAILKHHVVPARVTARDAVIAGSAKTLQGGSVEISIVDGRLQVNGAGVVGSDVMASNGVIHVVDAVILPR